MSSKSRLPGSPPINEAVSESLLSWTKDVRYLNGMQQLIDKALRSTRIFDHNVMGDSKLAWYASYILYIVVIFGSKGRTLGMEATGLNFEKGKSLATLMTRTIGFLWVFDWITTRSDPQIAHESLRGIERRRQYRALRQQMLTRNSNNQGNTQPIRVSHPQTTPKVVLRRLVQVVLAGLDQTARINPHSPLEDSNRRASDSFPSIDWLVRFHLSRYLITGIFPTFLHRFLNLRHVKCDGSFLTVQQGTRQTMAMLLALNNFATMFRSLTASWTNVLAKYIERVKRRSRIPEWNKVRTSSVYVEKDQEITSVCAVCRTCRKKPAVSKVCGHVFCWPCWKHWVSVVNEACPLCRTSCQLSDIQILFNYDGP